MRRLLLFVLALWVVSPLLQAETPDSSRPPVNVGPLVEVFRLSQVHDAEYLAAKAELDASNEAYPQARSVILPTLSASAAVSEIDRDVRATPFSDRPAPNDGDVGPRAPFTDRFTSETWGVELRQPIFNWAIPASLRQGKARVERGDLTFRTEYKLLVHRSAARYVQFLSAAEQLRFAQAESKAIAEDLELARARYDVGETGVTALREAQAAFDLAETRVIEAERVMNEQREELERGTGRWYQKVPSLKKEFPLSPPQPASPQAWIERANTYNSRILISELDKEIAQDEIAQKKSSLIPDVDLVAAYSDLDQEEFVFGSASADKSLGLEATWTLFSGGRSLSEIRESRARYVKSQYTQDVTVRDVHILVRNEYRRVLSSIRRVQALDEAIKSGRAALESTSAGFDVGERTQADVLTARRNLYRALTDHATARYQYLAAVLNLKLYAGVLAEEDLEQLDLILTGPALPAEIEPETVEKEQ